MEAQCQDKLKSDRVRNYENYPEIFGLTEDEVIEIREALFQYSNEVDANNRSQSYKDWLKMYNGVHREFGFDGDFRNWLACVRWMKSKNSSNEQV